MILDGIDYGDGYAKAEDRGLDVQLLSDNKWIPNAQAFDLEPEEIYRRPMTQAEKDAEAKQPERDENDLVVSIGQKCLGMADRCILGLPYDPTVTATRIIAMVREHDRNHIADAGKIGLKWTRTKPTIPGMYLFDSFERMVQLYLAAGDLIASDNTGDFIVQDSSDKNYWLGPLPDMPISKMETTTEAKA